MFYKPKIPQQSDINTLSSTSLYDGINYQVIRTPHYIIKQYQSESIEQINELLKRIEFEFIIAQRNKNLIIQAVSYQIQNRDMIYLNLKIEDAGINIQQLIELKQNIYNEQYDKEYKNKNKQIKEQQILDEQALKELVDDEEQIDTKQKLSDYDEQYLAKSVRKQIQFPSEKLDLILKNSLMNIQHLEQQGIRFTKMKLSNIFLNESSMRYSDLINQSSLFEETLQQYLRIEEDEIEPPHDQSHQSHVFQLGLVILQITLLMDFKIDYQLNLDQQGINQTNLSGYVKQIKSSQSNFLVTMLELMLNLKGTSITYVTDILESEIYKQLTYVEDKQQKQQQLQIMEKKQIVQDRLAKQNISSIDDFWDQQNPSHQILSTKQVQKESFVREGIYIIKNLNAKKLLKTTNIILTLQVINLHHNQINNVKFIIFTTLNGSIHLIDYQKFDEIAVYQCSQQSLNNSIIINHQNNINYIVGGSDKQVYVFSKIDIQQWLDDGLIQPKLVLQGHNSHITTLDSLKNGKILASGDREGYILLWDMIKFDQIIGIKIHDGALNQILQITPLRLASCSSDTVIKIWELEEIIKPDGNPAEVQILEGHRSDILRMVVSREKLISFEKDGKIRIWIWSKEKEFFQFLYFLEVQNNIRSIACVKESIFLVGDVQGWVNILNFDERLVLNKLKLHSNSVICMINILNSGQLILSSGQDGLIKKFLIKNE